VDRVLIVGVGGIGGVIAGRLVEENVPVVALARPALARHLRARGLVLRDASGERIVTGLPVLDHVPAETFDLVVLATQPHQVEAAARDVLPALAPGGAMIVTQNGLCEERVAAIVGPERVIGAVVAFGASSPSPGVAERTSRGDILLGRLDGSEDELLVRAAMALSAVAPAHVTRNLLGARWSKLAINCAVSSLGTLGGDRLGPLLAHLFVRRLGLQVITEVVQVAAAEGVTLERVARVDLRRVALRPGQRRGASLALKHGVLLAVGARYRRLRSSMLAAIERGLEPPIDHLNGEVVERARRHGIAVPANEAVVEAVRALARGDLKPGLPTLRAVEERLSRAPGALAS
jgi:2-dehydropantoate 2-reductase